MARAALALAFGAMIAVGLPSPGPYVALGLGIAACGTGLSEFRRRDLPGMARIAGAAAVTVGTIACLLALARVLLIAAAIYRMDRMLPG